MITLHPIAAGHGIDYLLSTVFADDLTIGKRDLQAHWAGGADTPGQWIGRTALALGLEGDVTQADADAIFKEGVHPRTGQVLGARWHHFKTVDERYHALLAREPNATRARRDELRARAETAGERTSRSGWEMVFSPNKSFAMLWGFSDDTMRRRLEAAEEAAFTAVFQRIENETTYTRTGYGGIAQVQVQAPGLVAAVFNHRSSRSGDPAFHRHLAISAKVNHDGRWLSLDARPLHRMVVTFSELYTARLELEMHREFGITAAARSDTVHTDKRAVREFLGVSNRAIKGFSSRRQQTEHNLTALLTTFRQNEGREPSRAEQYKIAQIATLSNRPAKQVRDADSERKDWRRRASGYGISRPKRIMRQAQRASAKAQQTPTVALAQLPATVVRELEGRRSTWTTPNVEAEAIRQLTLSGWHLSPDHHLPDLIREVTTAALHPRLCKLVDVPDLVETPKAYLRQDGTPVFQQVGSTRFTSHAILAAEQAVIVAAKNASNARTLTFAQVDAALDAGDRRRGFEPTDEQRAIVRAIFSAKPTVTAIIGRAGTGKTTIMALIREVADAYGIAMLGLANGQIQADALADAAGLRSENLARWRTMSERARAGDPEWTLPPGAIVVLDEAGQAATPDIAAILAQVSAVGGRLLPVGDPLQLGAVGAGGLLAEIETRTEALYLTEVRRFRDANGRQRTWEIQAAAAIAAGDAETAYRAYDARGRIHAGSHDSMLDAAYRHYLADLRDGLASILIAPDNATAAALSARVQEARTASGQVNSRSRRIALVDGNHAAEGDIVTSRRNDRTIRATGSRGYVRNGDVWTIERVHRDGRLQVKHQISGARATLPDTYVALHVDLGYALTKDRAQGLTLDTAHGLVTSQMTRNGLYPASTRGRYSNHLYVITSPPIDLETGDPGEQLTARQVWAAVVERDGTDQSAHAARRKAWNESTALSTHYPRLRYTLEDLADKRLVLLVRDGLPDIGDQIVNSPAWPTLHAVLMNVEQAGADALATLHSAAQQRELDTADDVAAVLHYRIINTRTYQDLIALCPVDLEAAGGNELLARLGVVMPKDDDTSDEARFARDLAAVIALRADQVADQAIANAAARTGWAALYGPPPHEADQVEQWQTRLRYAAIYRDLLARTDESDPVGPAPMAGDPRMRRLWRDGVLEPSADGQRAHAVAAAASGEKWLDALGPIPADADPRYQVWMSAAVLVLRYRQLWEYGREDAALGTRPSEPVQAADHDAAAAALARLRDQSPVAFIEVVEADDRDLRLAIGRGQAGAADAAAADRALAALYLAQAAATAAAQAADDADNRAHAAVRQAAAASTRAADRLIEWAGSLAEQAVQIRAESDAAQLDLATVQDRYDRFVPPATANRRAVVEAEAAQVELDLRGGARHQSQHPPWTGRTFGHLSDDELTAAHSDALNAAIAADHAIEAMTPGVGSPADPAAIDQAARQLYPRLATQIDAIGRVEHETEQATELAAVAENLATQVAQAQDRLDARGAFGRPTVRGQERNQLDQQLTELRADHAQALADARTAHERLRETQAAAGSSEDFTAAMELWADGLTAITEESARADREGDLRVAEMAELADEARGRAAQIRAELRIRQTMDPQLRESEDEERALAARESQETDLDEEAEISDAYDTQIEDDRTMRLDP